MQEYIKHLEEKVNKLKEGGQDVTGGYVEDVIIGPDGKMLMDSTGNPVIRKIPVALFMRNQQYGPQVVRGNDEQVEALKEELKQSREQTSQVLARLDESKRKDELQGALGPILSKLAEIEGSNRTREEKRTAKQEVMDELRNQGVLNQGVEPTVQVALKELDTKVALLAKGMENTHGTVNNLISLLAKSSQGPSNAETSPLKQSEVS